MNGRPVSSPTPISPNARWIKAGPDRELCLIAAAAFVVSGGRLFSGVGLRRPGTGFLASLQVRR